MKRGSPDMSRPMPMMLSLASADRAIVDSLQAFRKKFRKLFKIVTNELVYIISLVTLAFLLCHCSCYLLYCALVILPLMLISSL